MTCAEELAAAWAAVTARVDDFGRYCGHLLADYLVLAAIPLPPAGDICEWTDGSGTHELMLCA